MKLISWNVNGFRAVLNKGFEETFRALDADVFCIQETKCSPARRSLRRPAMSNTGIQRKRRAIPAPRCSHGARLWLSALASAPKSTATRAAPSRWNSTVFTFVNVYTPNSQDGLRRIEYRMQWEDVLRAYLLGLDAQKACGVLR